MSHTLTHLTNRNAARGRPSVQGLILCRMMLLLLSNAAQGFLAPPVSYHPTERYPYAATFSLFTTTTTISSAQHNGDSQSSDNDSPIDDDPTSSSSSSSFTVGIVGDLHMDPRYMQDYEQGRQHWRHIFANEDCHTNHHQALVSLGDLGESQAVTPDSTELFSGTTACHTLAADYLSSMGVPYHVVGGNHDLEGLDEFATDQANLDMMLQVHNQKRPYFLEPIAEKTILVGLSSTVFRDAPYTSHEVTIDDYQLKWFETVLRMHPASKGWKVLVMTHAPPLGSGLRHLQENHVSNHCCWLNHSSAHQVTKFIELVREHACIKAWFSGHFHLGQDYPDSITFPNEQDDDTDRGSCVFCQTSVMRQETSRDGKRQSRLIRGNQDGLEICTVQHDQGGAIRVDATIQYNDENGEATYQRHSLLSNNNNDEQQQQQDDEAVYTPSKDDEYYVPPNADGEVHVPGTVKDKHSRAWWYMADGRVLGIVKGMLVEFEPSTLAPLGLVVGGDELMGKRVAVVNCDSNNAAADDNDDATITTQALMLLDDETGQVVVVQPNQDGSYWRKIVRNKVLRMKERQREQAAKEFAAKFLQEQKDERLEEPGKSSAATYITGDADYDALLELYHRSTNGGVSSFPISEPEDQPEINVVSSWGPYKSTSGTAKHTGVPGVTSTIAPHDDDDAQESAASTIAPTQPHPTNLFVAPSKKKKKRDQMATRTTTKPSRAF